MSDFTNKARLVSTDDPEVFKAYQDLRAGVLVLLTAAAGLFFALLVGLVTGSLTAGWDLATTPVWWYVLAAWGILSLAGLVRVLRFYAEGNRDDSIFFDSQRKVARDRIIAEDGDRA